MDKSILILAWGAVATVAAEKAVVFLAVFHRALVALVFQIVHVFLFYQSFAFQMFVNPSILS